MDCTVHGIAKNQTQLSNFHLGYKISILVASQLVICKFISKYFLIFVVLWPVGYLELFLNFQACRFF